MDYQRLLLDHLDLIDQIVRTTGRRRHLSAIEQDEFASFVRLRLVEHDYAILRKFQGRSSLWTYLAAVLERLSLDFCVERWGRWRPSTMAERLGPVAVTLECLTHRDGHTLEEAIEILRTDHAVEVTSSQLRAMWNQLPVRTRTVEVGEEAAAGVTADDTSEAWVADAARKQDLERLEQALASALAALHAQDRVMIALRFDHEMSVADIAKTFQTSVPTVHRRIDRGLKDLRAALSLSGFDPGEVSGLIGHPSLALSPLLRAEVEKFLGPVRLSKRDG
ncbi:MAG TPA: sigma-70 family RNA polymerase sigma factor [Vicinamibacterales bacterium]